MGGGGCFATAAFEVYNRYYLKMLAISSLRHIAPAGPASLVKIFS
jgi:hypothetical protein